MEEKLHHYHFSSCALLTVGYDMARKNLREQIFDMEDQIKHSLIPIEVFLGQQVISCKPVIYLNLITTPKFQRALIFQTGMP